MSRLFKIVFKILTDFGRFLKIRLLADFLKLDFLVDF